MSDIDLRWQVLLSLRPVATTALAFGLGLTSLSKQPKHPRINLFVISIMTLTAFYFLNDFSPDDYLNEIIARTLLIWLAHMSFLLCLVPTEALETDRKRFVDCTQQAGGGNLNHEVSCEGRKSERPKAKHQYSNWRYGLKMLFSRREIGKPWGFVAAAGALNGGLQIKNSAREPKPSRSPTKTLQSRRSFLIHRGRILLCRYVALCIYFDPSVYRNTTDGKPWNSLDFAPERQVFMRRLICPFTLSFFRFCYAPITLRDCLIRVWLGLDLVVSDYLALSSFHDILAIISVSLDFDSPEEWPLLFGSITEAYTVRNFWSRFWHRLIYRSFHAHASLFSKKVLGIRRGAAFARYANNGFVFLLSGLMHTLVERRQREQNSECSCWGVTLWYCMQLAAIVLEDMIQRAWVRIEVRLPLGTRQRNSLRVMKMLVGYIWVTAWIIWSRSKTYYPKTYCMMEANKKVHIGTNK